MFIVLYFLKYRYRLCKINLIFVSDLQVTYMAQFYSKLKLECILDFFKHFTWQLTLNGTYSWICMLIILQNLSEQFFFISKFLICYDKNLAFSFLSYLRPLVIRVLYMAAIHYLGIITAVCAIFFWFFLFW